VNKAFVAVAWLLPQAAWAGDGSEEGLFARVLTVAIILLFSLGMAFIVAGLTNHLFRADLVEAELARVKERMVEAVRRSVSVSVSALGRSYEKELVEASDILKRLAEEEVELENRKKELERLILEIREEIERLESKPGKGGEGGNRA